MAKFSVSADACETARLLARLGKSKFIPKHIEKNWAEFPPYNDSWIAALKLFLRFYAFERNRAPLVYKDAAVHAVEHCEDTLNTEKASWDVWEEFKRRCLGKVKGPYSKCNPLNSEGTRYCDAITFCKTLAAPDHQNLYLFCLRKIESNNVRAAHSALREIRGIGPKIASLFLRDIALKNNIPDIGRRDRHLLQPIDVWLERTAHLLTGRKLTKDEAAQQLIRLADEAGCSALCLNAGSWYFGAKVARTEQQHESALKNPQSFKHAIERHRNAAKGQRRRLLEDAFPHEVADHAGQPSGAAEQRAADEKSDNDKFTWGLGDVVWVKDGQSEEEAIEAAMRLQAATKTSPAKTTPKATKPKHESLASHLTALLVQGGHIEEIRDKVNAHADRLGVKKITAGRVRDHAKWRSRRGAYTVKEEASGFIRMVPAARPKLGLSTATTLTDPVNARGQSATAPLKGN